MTAELVLCVKSCDGTHSADECNNIHTLETMYISFKLVYAADTI